MQPETQRTWLWQLSYAVLGFAFLMSPIAMAVTGNWVVTAITAVSCIVLLFILNRVINGPARGK